jgi:hypothetical protein
MVIDDVQEDREAKTMGGVHELTEIVRGTIRSRGREEAHAVVSPVARPGEIGDRH